jgi:mono/diheme cytochrome c family protein
LNLEPVFIAGKEIVMKKIFLTALAVVTLMGVFMALIAVDSSTAADTKEMSAAAFDMEAAKATFEEYCGKCHGVDRALGKQKDKDGWESTVSRMSGYHKRFGAPIPEDAEDAIIGYLVKVAGK